MTIELKTNEEFKDRIFDYENEKDWKYKGDKPAILDFMADWCGPCKVTGPILDDLANEYKGKVDIYKINVDDLNEVAGTFGIRSIPSLLFIPINEQPQMAIGALPKESIEKTIKETLKVE